MERLSAAEAELLRDVAAQAGAPNASAATIAAAIATARALFTSADVFRRAAAIVDEQRARAAAAAATCRHARLREVLEFLLDLAVPEQAALSMVG
jgi:hypothetical protein